MKLLSTKSMSAWQDQRFASTKADIFRRHRVDLPDLLGDHCVVATQVLSKRGHNPKQPHDR